MRSELFETIRDFTKESVNEKRYDHSMRTAHMLADLCKKYNLDEEKGWIAGIAHDMCKDFSDEDLFALAQKDGMPFSDLEKKLPALLHGRAAAVLIQEKFKVKDPEIIDAIANHTFGSPDSCDFALLLFVADKIEPGRPQSSDEYRAKLLSLSCHDLVLAVVDENIEYLTSRGKTVAQVSLMLSEKLRAEKGQ